MIDKLDKGRTLPASIGQTLVVAEDTGIRGLELASGRELWKHEQAVPVIRFQIAGRWVVVESGSGAAADSRIRVDVLDPQTGKVAWRSEQDTLNVAVYADAVYLFACKTPKARKNRGCTITSREVADGRTRWTVPSAMFNVETAAIGNRSPYAPAAGPYLAAGIWPANPVWGALDRRTGAAQRGRVPNMAWSQFAAGRNLVATDHDPPSGDRECTVKLVAADAVTGERPWTASVYSGRRKNDECAKVLAGGQTGIDYLGSGTRLVASTAGGKPQLFDLATGRTVWTAEKPGVPVDGDGRAVLVRQYADSGDLALLDLATGKQRWTAPDPELKGQLATWRTAVTGKLVVMIGSDERGAGYVRVNDIADGRQLGRFPGWFVSAGDDWVMVERSGEGNDFELDLIRF